MSRTRKKLSDRPRYAEAWKLAVQGKTYTEIADILGLSASRVYTMIRVYRERLIPVELKDYVKDFLCDQCTLLQKDLFEELNKATSLKDKIKLTETIIKLNERLDKLHGISVARTDLTTNGNPINFIITSDTGNLTDDDI